MESTLGTVGEMRTKGGSGTGVDGLLVPVGFLHDLSCAKRVSKLHREDVC